jgi:hypothetical protein
MTMQATPVLGNITQLLGNVVVIGDYDDHGDRDAAPAAAAAAYITMVGSADHGTTMGHTQAQQHRRRRVMTLADVVKVEIAVYKPHADTSAEFAQSFRDLAEVYNSHFPWAVDRQEEGGGSPPVLSVIRVPALGGGDNTRVGILADTPATN